MRLFIFFLLWSTLYLDAGKVNTADYWNCEHKVGGSWNFGRVPNGCDVNPFGEPSYVYDNFHPLIFDDNTGSIATERIRYMNELVALIQDASSYYITSRNPSVSLAEKEAWSSAILAKAHQETFMTHYRTASDNRLKMIRGDYGHGHGMMQIDDRWHFTKINEGKGWHIFENIIYAFDIYYDAWIQAKSASCVHSYYDQSRSAYSIYNGGASKECRWTNPNDTWARNDINYKEKLDNKTWENYVDDMSAHSSLNVPCFMEGNEVCEDVILADDNETFANRLLHLSSGEYCIFDGANYICTEQLRDSLCLAKEYNLTLQEPTLTLNTTQSQNYPKEIKNRDICYNNIDNLYKIGEYIQTQQAINIRQTAGGTLLGQTPENRTYQILDFEVQTETEKRYYRIKYNDIIGYIYAGNSVTNTTWVTPLKTPFSGEVLIPNIGDTITIQASSGINARESIGGTVLGLAQFNQTYHVIGRVIRGVENYIYYQIDLEGTPSYIYGGKLLPTSNQSSWVSYAGKYLHPLLNRTFNDDNITDILFRNQTNGKNLIFMQNSDGSQESYSYTSPLFTGWKAIGVGHFNDDNITDILFRNKTNGKNLIFMQSVDGSRENYVYTTTLSNHWLAKGIGDFNKDGISDILFRHTTNGKNIIFFQNSDGSRDNFAYTSPLSNSWNVAGVGDFNQDGIADILFRHTTNGKNLIFFQNSDGTRKNFAYTSPLSTSWNVAGVGDFNQDGITDILFRHTTNGKNLIFFQNSDGSRKNFSYTTSLSNSWKVAMIGDFNGDNINDILFRHTSNGKNLIYFQNSDGTRKGFAYTNPLSNSWKVIR